MKVIRILFRILYLWYWFIPIHFGMLAFVLYFGIIYLLYGTLNMSEIEHILGKSEKLFFFCFWLPFGVPLLLSLGSIFGSPVGANSSHNDALNFRNGQMSISSDKEASEILKETSYLDMLNSNNSEVFEKAKRGFEAKYGAKPPTEVFNDMMKNKENT